MATETSTSTRAPAGGSASKVGPVAGIAFVVLFLLGFLLLATPDADESDAKWTAYWQDSGHRTSAIISSIAVLLSAVALLWLVGAIRRRIPSGAVGADAAFAGGLACGVTVLMAGFGRGLIAVGHNLADVPIPKDPDLLRFADGFYYGVIFLALPFAIAAFLIPLFFALRGALVFPAWLGILGLVVGVVALSGPFLFVLPLLLFLIWVLIASVVLLVRDGRATSAG